MVARVLVVFGWLQPVTWLGVAAVWIRRGSEAALTVLEVGQGATVAAALAVVLAGRLGRSGLVVYVPTAAACAATMVTWMGGTWMQ